MLIGYIVDNVIIIFLIFRDHMLVNSATQLCHMFRMSSNANSCKIDT